MSFDPATGNGTQARTWVAAGAIEDTGTSTDVFHIGPGRDGCGITIARTGEASTKDDD